MDSPRAGKSEDSLLIFGSVNMDMLRTRISKQEERPSRVSWLWVTLLAQETLYLKQLPHSFPRRTRDPNLKMEMKGWPPTIKSRKAGSDTKEELLAQSE